MTKSLILFSISCLLISFVNGWRIITNIPSDLHESLRDMALNLRTDSSDHDYQGHQITHVVTYTREEAVTHGLILRTQNISSSNLEPTATILHRRIPTPLCDQSRCNTLETARLNRAALNLKATKAVCGFMDSIGTSSFVNLVTIGVTGAVCGTASRLTKCTVTVIFGTNGLSAGLGKFGVPACQFLIDRAVRDCVDSGGNVDCIVADLNKPGGQTSDVAISVGASKLLDLPMNCAPVVGSSLRHECAEIDLPDSV